MLFKNVVVESSSWVEPPEFISSTQIEEQLDNLYSRLKLPKGRLELMTGIKTRGFWPNGTASSLIASNAALKVFQKSNIQKKDIDVLIHSSVCRDFLEPATASVVHKNLGLSERCQIFDLSNACLGFLNSIVVAANMVERESAKNVLIVSGENGGPLLYKTIEQLRNDQYIDRKGIKSYIANLTIGSAGVAAIISNSNYHPGLKILGGSCLTDTSYNELCYGDGNTDSLNMQTDSEKLLEAGLDVAKRNWSRFIEVMNWKDCDYKWIINHQVGIAHQKRLLEDLMLQGKYTHSTFDRLGNTGSAALPITLFQALENKLIAKDENIALLGIGSGLSSIMLGVKNG